ncbi:alpha/beta fold hydrolase [Herbiconiux sp. KACC 21604]|uniref:alpha/beta fold hydrolase n=1 Tax=unclassified Herbiconiux TaxID=2618217 RepID=UPI001490FFC1|nr:alpha/beta fold hydrolase [Herbiconiux sp. SALV-R1]QJU55800.1 alpha/beta fold hydrolase [Herbiconiux sp. SALV-R1]WPO87013.1 alpha/beta fold hydrolase [Herbiconiux sp. KACC 21604]
MSEQPEPRRGRTRRVVGIAALAVGLTVAVVVGLVLATSYWSAGIRLEEGAVEESTEQPFYTLPSPAPAAAPGTLLRTEPLPSAPAGAVAWRVLYHSADVLGNDIVVSGVVVAPDGEPPQGGRPVVSWAHPTTGAAARCAPSVGIDPFDLIEGLDDLLDAGYVVAATDYSGMGVEGPDSYLIGETEGNNVLDAARAARALDGAGAGDELVLWGHSQGGQAALFAAERAESYAPELQLKAVGVAAPATDLVALLKADIGDVSGVTIGAYAFTAYASVYGPSTPGAELDTILTPAAVEAAPTMNELCLLGQNSELHAIGSPLIGGFLSGDPGTVEPWATLLKENTPGSSGEPLPVPLFVAQGDVDELVRPEITADFVDEQRAAGTEVTYETVENTGHGLVADRALPGLLRWLGSLGLPS